MTTIEITVTASPPCSATCTVRRVCTVACHKDRAANLPCARAFCAQMLRCHCACFLQICGRETYVNDVGGADVIKDVSNLRV